MNTAFLAEKTAEQTTTRGLEEIRDSVRNVLLNGKSERVLTERRHKKRHAYPYPLFLTPVSDDGTAIKEETFAVLGKHLSEGGLDFYHTQPLSYRRVIVSLELAGGQWVGLMMDLSWCRFNQHGWYENGGRFLFTTRSPREQVV